MRERSVLLWWLNERSLTRTYCTFVFISKCGVAELSVRLCAAAPPSSPRSYMLGLASLWLAAADSSPVKLVYFDSKSPHKAYCLELNPNLPSTSCPNPPCDLHTDGAEVDFWECGHSGTFGDVRDQWTLTVGGQIKSALNQKCLEVYGAGNVGNKPYGEIDTWNCTASSQYDDGRSQWTWSSNGQLASASWTRYKEYSSQLGCIVAQNATYGVGSGYNATIGDGNTTGARAHARRRSSSARSRRPGGREGGAADGAQPGREGLVLPRAQPQLSLHWRPLQRQQLHPRAEWVHAGGERRVRV